MSMKMIPLPSNGFINSLKVEVGCKNSMHMLGKGSVAGKVKGTFARSCVSRSDQNLWIVWTLKIT